MDAAHEQALKHTRIDAMSVETKKPTKRAKSSAPKSALEAEKQALKEEAAARKARASAASKAEKEAKKAERASKRAQASATKKQTPAEQALPPEEPKKQIATSRPRARRAKEDADLVQEEQPKRKFEMPSFDFSPQGIAAWAGAHRLFVGVFIACIFVIVFLYPPISSFYAACRTNATLSGRLEEVTQSVDELSSDVSKLTSEEGIKDEARRRGYVEDGETAVEMQGIEDSGSAASDTTVMQEAQEEQTETPWYFVILDFIFRYNPNTQGVG